MCDDCVYLFGCTGGPPREIRSLKWEPANLSAPDSSRYHRPLFGASGSTVAAAAYSWRKRKWGLRWKIQRTAARLDSVAWSTFSLHRRRFRPIVKAIFFPIVLEFLIIIVFITLVVFPFTLWCGMASLLREKVSPITHVACIRLVRLAVHLLFPFIMRIGGWGGNCCDRLFFLFLFPVLMGVLH